MNGTDLSESDAVRFLEIPMYKGSMMNVAQAMKIIASVVLADQLRDCLRSYDRERLEQAAECGYIGSYIGLDFRKAASKAEGSSDELHASLYLGVEGFGGTRREDEKGNLWYDYGVRAQVSWPSWGSTGTDLARERLEFMLAVTALAERVKAALPGTISELRMTKAERDEFERQMKLAGEKRAVEEAVLAHAKGLKVGQQRYVGADGRTFVRGSYDVDRFESGRTFKYRAFVTSSEGFYFTRLA